MKKPALLLSCLITSLSVLSAQADVVTDWNNAALQAIKATRINPPRASRSLAMAHIAIYDSINAIDGKHESYLFADRHSRRVLDNVIRHLDRRHGNVSRSRFQIAANAAATAAAHKVLLALYPAEQGAFDTLRASSLAALGNGRQKELGIALGEWIGQAVLNSRANDNSGLVVPYAPGTNPADWQPTPPAFAASLLPNWPLVTCFALENGAQFRPPPPPSLSSPQWAAEFNEVKALGAKVGSTRTPEQSDIALFWADGAGTVTPPGHWNVIAQDISAQRALSMVENARLFALLNIAMADAAIVAWDCKYAYNFWRPITAIRNGDLDGNDATEKDATWESFIVTPPFPDYTSGHSTFSGSAATVLALYFGSDAIPFTTLSEDLPGVSRSFISFSQAAEEAGMSRIFGGIHYMAANVAGLDSGASLGEYVVQNYLRSKRHRSHGDDDDDGGHDRDDD